MKDECINCGAWKGLHHYETNQCPRNGQEAQLGKLQEWDNTVYQELSTNSGTNYVEALLTQNAEQAATIARLTAANDNTNALLDEQGAHINEQALKISHLTKTNAELTAAHEMQGEELVTLPRHMVIGLEDKLKAQAEEIESLKGHLLAIETITALSDYEMSFKSFKAIRAHTLAAGGES